MKLELTILIGVMYIFFLIGMSRLQGADVAAVPDADPSVPADCPNIKLRGSLENSRIVFEKTHKGNVAFIGGSITEGGYPHMVADVLKKRFPKTQFDYTFTGIASTCSTTGAMRLQTDVLDKGPVDLLFVEFAVNDDQDAHHDRRDCIRGLEGIIRHVREHNPSADIVVTYFVNEHMLAVFKSGQEPLSSSSHDEVLRHYQVSGIELNREIFDRIQAGTLTWKQYGGVHPALTGNRICANMIDRLFDRAWAAPLAVDAVVKPHPAVDPLDANSYEHGRFVDVSDAQIVRGWNIETPDWTKLEGTHRLRFDKEKLLCASEPGSELKLKFEGNAIGIYLLAGPDAGMLNAIIDDAPAKQFDLWHENSGGLHYPRTIMFNADLPPGPHMLTLVVADERNGHSKGSTARILKFCAN